MSTATPSPFEAHLDDLRDQIGFGRRALKAIRTCGRRFTPIRTNGVRYHADDRFRQLRIVPDCDIEITPPPVVAAQTGWTLPQTPGAVGGRFARAIERTAWVGGPGNYRVARVAPDPAEGPSVPVRRRVA